MYLEERRQAIIQLVNTQGSVSVDDLSQHFEVSEVTIRADLKALAERNLVIRTHGGAIATGYGLQELSLTKRRNQNATAKQRIATAAADFIADGEAIFLDSSSTVLAIIPYLALRRDLTVITNSLVLAQELLGQPNVTVVMPGGTLHPDTASLIDAEALAYLQRYNIARGFFGAHGLSFSAGLTDVSAQEAALKRQLVAMCGQVITLLDASKWGRTGVASFANVEDVDMVITDSTAPADAIRQARTSGINVIQV